MDSMKDLIKETNVARVLLHLMDLDVKMILESEDKSIDNEELLLFSSMFKNLINTLYKWLKFSDPRVLNSRNDNTRPRGTGADSILSSIKRKYLSFLLSDGADLDIALDIVACRSDDEVKELLQDQGIDF